MEGAKNASSVEQRGERHEELKQKYLTRLLPVIQRQRLSHLRLDDIVRFMDISKATFYKYFSSKEDVIEQGVELVVTSLKQATALIGDESSSPLLRFQHAFMQSVDVACYLPEELLLDLKQLSPPLWERVKQARLEFQQQLQRFYEQGVTQGIFHPLKPMLAVLQSELFLRNIMDPVFLVEHDLTLRTLLYDYYELQKYQWLLPEFAEQIDDAPVRAFIDRIIHKFSQGMRSEG
ncbi:TetR family transcriptional regulator [Reticulibacter mediterranei]|uniref:TetR family transcriptional regulator n=1 Tax=Reticulibacter mediterranei TaxID=2778369 RepID=A0A8J3IR53_9CHLR|nr:TetR/AcrR family transcriptional regulator [Reticulibacter mediterranei]GHO97078.1 TetR family transcriptional regulator [Reticulibacter mediterranei]